MTVPLLGGPYLGQTIQRRNKFAGACAVLGIEWAGPVHPVPQFPTRFASFGPSTKYDILTCLAVSRNMIFMRRLGVTERPDRGAMLHTDPGDESLSGSPRVRLA